MKPAEHDEVGLEARDGVGERPVPVLAAGELADLLDERRDAGALGAGQALDAVAVGADGDHPGAVRRVAAGVEQGLEVGARARARRTTSAGAGHAEWSLRRCSRRARGTPAAATRSCEPAEQAADPERGDRVHEDVERGRPDLAHPARADRSRRRRAVSSAEEHAGQHAAGTAAQRALVPAQGRGCGAGSGRRRAPRAAAARPRRYGVQAGVGPLSGSAASSGNIGSGPIETRVGETSVPAPTAKPGPSR